MRISRSEINAAVNAFKAIRYNEGQKRKLVKVTMEFQHPVFKSQTAEVELSLSGSDTISMLTEAIKKELSKIIESPAENIIENI